MGLSGTYTDSITGATLEHAYISLYQSSIQMRKLNDQDVQIDSGSWGVYAQANVFSSEDARRHNKKWVTSIGVNVFLNDPSNIASAIYEKLKETIPDLTDC